MFMEHTPQPSKPVLGRSAFIDLPEFGLDSIPSKTDTGAYRSAIHAANITVKNTGTRSILAFDVLHSHRNAGQSTHVETAEFREVEVENSFGHREKRYEVKILVVLEGKRFRTSFTLADRSKKIYPVLMGRRLINRRFIVDTTITHVDRKLLKERFNIDLPKDEEEL